jgi:hypothetical protein
MTLRRVLIERSGKRGDAAVSADAQIEPFRSAGAGLQRDHASR